MTTWWQMWMESSLKLQSRSFLRFSVQFLTCDFCCWCVIVARYFQLCAVYFRWTCLTWRNMQFGPWHISHMWHATRLGAIVASTLWHCCDVCRMTSCYLDASATVLLKLFCICRWMHDMLNIGASMGRNFVIVLWSRNDDSSSLSTITFGMFVECYSFSCSFAWVKKMISQLSRRQSLKVSCFLFASISLVFWATDVANGHRRARCRQLQT